jgi:hypothetical protein
MLGTHVVTVSVHTTNAPTELPAVDPAAGPTAINKAIEEEMTRAVRQQRHAEKAGKLPAKYATRDTSNLRKEVVDGDNKINIDFTD